MVSEVSSNRRFSDSLSSGCQGFLRGQRVQRASVTARRQDRLGAWRWWEQKLPFQVVHPAFGRAFGLKGELCNSR